MSNKLYKPGRKIGMRYIGEGLDETRQGIKKILEEHQEIFAHVERLNTFCESLDKRLEVIEDWIVAKGFLAYNNGDDEALPITPQE